MLPVLFELHVGEAVRPIGGFGLAVSLGMWLAAAWSARAAARDGDDVGATLACAGFGIAGGLAGAWLTHLLVEWVRTGSPMDALRGGGGLVFYGAVPGGVLAAWLGSRGLGLDLVRALDRSVAGLALGHAFGRLGCFLGGCCYGRPWDGPWAVVFAHPLAPAAYPSVPRHPVQLYEAAGLVVLGLVWAVWRPSGPPGTRALSYVVAYGALRCVTELFRGDVERGSFGPVSTSQLIALATIALGSVALVRRGRVAGAAPGG